MGRMPGGNYRDRGGNGKIMTAPLILPAPETVEFDGHKFPKQLTPMDLQILYWGHAARRGDESAIAILMFAGVAIPSADGKLYWPTPDIEAMMKEAMDKLVAPAEPVEGQVAS